MKTSTKAFLVGIACFAFGTLMAYFASYRTPHYYVYEPEDVFGPYISTWIAYGFGLLFIIGGFLIRGDERKASLPSPQGTPLQPPQPTCPKCGQALSFLEGDRKGFCPTCFGREFAERRIQELQKPDSSPPAANGARDASSEAPPPPPSLPPTPPQYRRPSKLNRKMIIGITAIVIVGVIIVALLMRGGDVGGPRVIKDESDAQIVGSDVRWTIGELVRVMGTDSRVEWDDKRVEGLSGYAVINGEYEYSVTYPGYTTYKRWTYDVGIQLYDFCSGEGSNHLTGSATLDGTQYYKSDAEPESYGQWSLTGSVSLSDSYECTITFDIAIVEYSWWGTITSGGTTWEVGSNG